MLALRIEGSNSKKQILETYLNEIYLGRGAYGIEAAAQAYFGKKTADLTVNEAAYIAGLAAGPSKYGPENVDQTEDRRRYVLKAMLKSRVIATAIYQNALQEKPVLLANAPDYGLKESYFTEAVRRYIISQYGEKTLYEGGLLVRTTLDPDLQNRAERAVLHGATAWERRQGRRLVS